MKKKTPCPHGVRRKQDCRICYNEYHREWSRKRVKPVPETLYRRLTKHRMFARTCTQCKWLKWSKDFPPNGHGNICTKCGLEKMKRWYIENREQANQAGTNRKVIANYGITFWEHRRIRAIMYWRQGESCAICQRGFPLPRLVLDHCHATGVLRGLLCTACNYAIGALRDDPILCMRSADYLTK